MKSQEAFEGNNCILDSKVKKYVGTCVNRGTDLHQESRTV